MNAFTAVVLALAVASASAGHLALGLVHPAAHIPSGSVSVGHDGAVIAGPSGSVRTDNGLHGHGAGAQLSGPAGDVATQGGHARLAGPGLEHAVHVVPQVAPISHHAVVAHASIVGPSSHASIVGPVSHASIVGPSSHASIVGPVSHASIVAPIATSHHAINSWGHSAVLAAPAINSWGHSGVLAAPAVHGVLSHGLIAHGHHGW